MEPKVRRCGWGTGGAWVVAMVVGVSVAGGGERRAWEPYRQPAGGAGFEGAAVGVRQWAAVRNRDSVLARSVFPVSDGRDGVAGWWEAWDELWETVDAEVGPGVVYAGLPVPPRYPPALVRFHLEHPFPGELPPGVEPGEGAWEVGEGFWEAVRPARWRASEVDFVDWVRARVSAGHAFVPAAARRAYRGLGVPATFWWFFDPPRDDAESGRIGSRPLDVTEEVFLPGQPGEWGLLVRNHCSQLPGAGGGTVGFRWIDRVPVDAAGGPSTAARSGRVALVFPYQGDRGGTYHAIPLRNLSAWHGVVTSAFLVEDYTAGGAGAWYGVDEAVLDAWLRARLAELAARVGAKEVRVCAWGLSRGSWEALRYAEREPRAEVTLAFLGGHVRDTAAFAGRAVVLVNTLGASGADEAEPPAGVGPGEEGMRLVRWVSRPNWGDRRPGTGLGTRHSVDFLAWLLAAEATRLWAYGEDPFGVGPKSGAREALAALERWLPRVRRGEVSWGAGSAASWDASAGAEAEGLLVVAQREEAEGAFPAADAAAFASGRNWVGVVTNGGLGAAVEHAERWREVDGGAGKPAALVVLGGVAGPSREELRRVVSVFDAVTVVEPGAAWVADGIDERQVVRGRRARLAVFPKGSAWGAAVFRWLHTGPRGRWDVVSVGGSEEDLEPGYFWMLGRLRVCRASEGKGFDEVGELRPR